MEGKITISYPESLAWSLKMKDGEFEREMKIISLVKLYELGKISSGIASKILNITRLDFFKILAYYNVSYVGTSEDELIHDLENA
jgi:predicted HTH domain antitoxin